VRRKVDAVRTVEHCLCSLTPWSSGAPTAWHASHQALGLRPILRLLPGAPRCRGPLTANVRRQQPPLWFGLVSVCFGQRVRGTDREALVLQRCCHASQLSTLAQRSPATCAARICRRFVVLATKPRLRVLLWARGLMPAARRAGTLRLVSSVAHCTTNSCWPFSFGHQRRLTGRSRGGPTACHQAPAGSTLYIVAVRGLASHRRPPP
jgi:hypothetical protein